ncbi:hypothetical protein DB347_15330 [Opitutaceae bacterium EW11]|nr:hypothetical protein DB347_15330 [Opitutaceae bacterium EW11]
MSRLPLRFRAVSRCFFAAFFAAATLFAQEPPAAPAASLPDDSDSVALVLARRYLEGGNGSKEALHEALRRMGWGIRDAKGAVLEAPPAGADTGLAMRDYELEELLWKPSEQPAIRFISYAQALAVPFKDADPEELAQDLVETLRKSAESSQPQQRFWARFVAALGRVSPANYDLLSPAPPSAIPPSKSRLKQLEKQAAQNPFALMAAMRPTPVWAKDDPVLAPSPKPKRSENDTRESTLERDQKRLGEISQEMGQLSADLGSQDKARLQAAKDKMAKLTAEMSALSQRLQAAQMQQMSAAMQRYQKSQDGDASDEEDSGEADGARFTAEWRDQPLSLLQVALISRVFAADIRLAAQQGLRTKGRPVSLNSSPFFPVAVIGLAQISGPAPSSFSDQFSGAAGDIWATGWGAYTGKLLEHHLPDSKFSEGVGIANTIIAWFKTIMSVARQNITVEVENAPLVRTKTRSPGEQRTARAKVAIDFPKSDVLKAIRAAGNLTTIDLQMPDGGPVSGAKVVWRLPEGSYNTKYQTSKGGWEYKPELAVVQFAQGAGYVSSTDDAGEATIQIEGVPQRKQLSASVRPYPRRAVIAVEVTMKVGNLTQDLNDAINTAMGGPVNGTLGFIADMIMRTSFFFQKGRVFEVTDWKEPAWEGEFEIVVKASGSKHEKGEKGGPDADYAWKMDRKMEGRLHTPDWDEEKEEQKDYANDGRHRLEVDGDSRYFRLNDSSSARTKNSNNRYDASGPLQIQPPGYNQLARYSRAEPSGNASLMFNGGFMTLDLEPFFGAECLVSRSEQNAKRSSNKSGAEYLSLLGDISPSSFTIIEPNDGKQDYVEGSKTFDYRGNLPYVPSFDVQVTINYRLWKNNPPPKNK